MIVWYAWTYANSNLVKYNASYQTLDSGQRDGLHVLVSANSPIKGKYGFVVYSIF